MESSADPEGGLILHTGLAERCKLVEFDENENVLSIEENLIIKNLIMQFPDFIFITTKS